jgi:septum formation protein
VVLGCDQMLDLDGQGLDKVATRAEAADVLRRLRGKTHVLQSAIVACVEGAPVWRHLSQPKLRVRNFSDEFLETYLDQIGDAAFECVGCYQIEGLGAQLFDRIDGDYFSILGMPLLPLMQWLRDRGSLQP